MKDHKITSSASCSEKDSLDDDVSLFNSNHGFLAGPKAREEWFDSQLRKRKESTENRRQPSDEQKVPTFPPDGRGVQLQRCCDGGEEQTFPGLG